MELKQTTAYIDTLARQLNIPYLEVQAFRGHEPLYRHEIKPAEYGDKNKLYMYSCTKPITAVCAMQMLEAGKFSLDDRLVDYFPAYKDSYYLDEQGEKVAAGGQITLRHLMTMTAGLSYAYRTPAYDALHENGAQPTTAQIVETVAQNPLQFKPGQKFLYSFCLDVMAAVVEKVSGLRFADYVAKYIFQPLGMTNSHFVDNDKAHMIPSFRCENGALKPVSDENSMVKSVNFDSGGAGLISTVDDYAKFACALADGGKGPNGYVMLKPETIAMMASEEISISDVHKEFTCVQGKDYSYGLGVRVRIQDTPWGLQKGEYGWDGAAGSYLMVDPNKQIAVVMGMHILSWPQIFRDKHLAIVEQIYREMKL